MSGDRGVNHSTSARASDSTSSRIWKIGPKLLLNSVFGDQVPLTMGTHRRNFVSVVIKSAVRSQSGSYWLASFWQILAIPIFRPVEKKGHEGSAHLTGMGDPGSHQVKSDGQRSPQVWADAFGLPPGACSRLGNPASMNDGL